TAAPGFPGAVMALPSGLPLCEAAQRAACAVVVRQCAALPVPFDLLFVGCAADSAGAEAVPLRHVLMNARRSSPFLPVAWLLQSFMRCCCGVTLLPASAANAGWVAAKTSASASVTVDASFMTISLCAFGPMGICAATRTVLRRGQMLSRRIRSGC